MLKITNPPYQGTTTEVDRAWLASAIDGEGSIRFYTTKYGRMYANITVYNSNYDYVAKASEIMQCKIYKHTVSPKAIGKLPMYQALATNRDNIEYILRLVEPYLIIKREKALSVLQWYTGNPPSDPSEIMKRTWNNYSTVDRQKRLNKIRNGIIETNKTPITRKKRSDAMKRRWMNPDQRNKFLQGTIKGGIATASKFDNLNEGKLLLEAPR